ncbi:MAG: hypothetical protein LBH11_00110 [Propionibacteriaceae bacterium]|nr:hypothetical protein [Propionibacteriaceae bacterium]
MNRYVGFDARRNRGWPWPEISAGRNPMFGVDGFCRKCGIPFVPQQGSLVLQRSGLRVGGVWNPYWMGPMVCMEDSIANQVAERFDVQLLEVGWPKGPPGGAKQIIPAVTEHPWFDPEVLTATVTRYGTPGSECPICGVWKWRPIKGIWPPITLSVSEDRPVIASPEWFGGGGWASFHELLLVRELAELLVKASPRDFRIRDDVDIRYV